MSEYTTKPEYRTEGKIDIVSAILSRSLILHLRTGDNCWSEPKIIQMNSDFTDKQVQTIYKFTMDIADANRESLAQIDKNVRLIHWLTCLVLEPRIFASCEIEDEIEEVDEGDEDDEEFDSEGQKIYDILERLYKTCYFACLNGSYSFKQVLAIYYSKKLKIELNQVEEILSTVDVDVNNAPTELLYLPQSNQWQICLIEESLL